MSQTKAQLIDPVDGTIVNADINASAAIAASKIADFVSANTNNRVLTASGTANSLIGESALTFDGATLDINGGTTDTPLILDTTNSSGSHLRFRKDGVNKIFLGCGGGFGLGDVDDLSLRTTDNIIFGVSTSEKMRVDSSGRLLIGTTTNTFTGVGSSRLQISGTGADTAGANLIRVSNDGGGAYLQFTKNRGSATQANDTVGAISWMGHDGTDTESYFAQILVKSESNATNNNTQGSIRFGTSNGSSITSERMQIAANGTVGIGTTSPDSNYKLDVNGSIRMGDGNAGRRIQFSRSGLGDELVIGVDGTGVGSANDAVIQSSPSFGRPLIFGTSNAERLRIEAGGQLLIGHSSSVDVGSTASAKTQIHTSNSTLQFAIAGYGNNSGGAIFALGHSRSGTVGNATGALQDNDEIGTIRFAASDGTDMENTAAFISGIVDGSVSGNSTPGELALGVNNGAGSNANCILIRSDFDIFLGGASGANRMFQSNSKGFIYDHDGGGAHPFIGVQHSTKTTGAAAYISFQSQTSERGKIAESNSGNNVTYNTSSDYRLKQDEVLISDGITRLKQLKPYQFKWKDNLEYGYVDGFFAHEVGDVIKGSATGSKDEVVTQEGLDDGTYNKNRSVGDMVAQGLDYSRLTPLLTAALQEAISKIETLETEVAALKAA